MIPILILAIEDDADRAFMIALYERCHKAMYRQAFAVLQEREAAQDAVQDTVVKLIGKLAALRAIPEKQLLPYAAAAARMTAIDAWRAQKRAATVVSLGDVRDAAEAPDADAGTPEDAFIDMERVELLSRGLELLPEKERDLLIGRYILDMNDAELAQRLGVKPDSVRMYLTRAQKRACAAGFGGDTQWITPTRWIARCCV